MANKTFFTYDEQIEKLEKEKQLVISDPEFAKTTLQKLGYFSLIGGYKDLFKHKPFEKMYKHSSKNNINSTDPLINEENSNRTNHNTLNSSNKMNESIRPIK